jgi:hypothetical protein
LYYVVRTAPTLHKFARLVELKERRKKMRIIRPLVQAIAVICLFATFFIQATKAEVSTSYIQTLAKQYRAAKIFSALPRPLPPDPGQPQQPPQDPPGNYPRDCVDAVCQRLSRFDCDEPGELNTIGRFCVNVRPQCINTVCNHLSRFDCDEVNELQDVAGICRNLTNYTCIDYVCSHLGRFDCDEISEIRRIADQCRDY